MKGRWFSEISSVSIVDGAANAEKSKVSRLFLAIIVNSLPIRQDLSLGSYQGYTSGELEAHADWTLVPICCHIGRDLRVVC